MGSQASLNKSLQNWKNKTVELSFNAFIQNTSTATKQ